MTTVLVHG